MSSIANIGGQLNDFNITTSKMSNEQRQILDQIESIVKNLTVMNVSILFCQLVIYPQNVC